MYIHSYTLFVQSNRQMLRPFSPPKRNTKKWLLATNSSCVLNVSLFFLITGKESLIKWMRYKIWRNTRTKKKKGEKQLVELILHMFSIVVTSI